MNDRTTTSHRYESAIDARVAGYAALTGGAIVVLTGGYGLLFRGGMSPGGILAATFFGPLLFVASLLLAGGLVAVHSNYGEQYGRVGQITVVLLGIAFLARSIMMILEPGLGGELIGLTGVIGAFSDIGRFVLASVLGLILLRTTAPRAAAGLLAVVFPVALLSAPFLTDLLVLYYAATVLLGMAFVVLGWEVLSTSRAPPRDVGPA